MEQGSESMLSIPDVWDRARLGSYRSAVAQAERDLDAAKRQIACLGIEEAFEAHPELIAVRLATENVLDGGHHHMRVDAEVENSVSDADAPGWTKRHLEDLVRDILAPWGEDLFGVELTRSNHASEVGEAVMGAERHAQWQASRAKAALEAATPPAAKRGAPRV